MARAMSVALATIPERVSVVETKVDNIEEKLDDLKTDINASHVDIKEQLKTMYDASCEQHASLATKINVLERFKTKWMYLIMGGVAVIGFVGGHFSSLSNILK